VNIILDFDSTIIQAEGLDVLAEICFKEDKSKISEIEKITHQGMNGELSMQDSLSRRIELLEATTSDIDTLYQKLITKISATIHFLIDSKDIFPEKVYVVSGGFIEYVLPVCKHIGISENHIIANQFIYQGDKIIGFNTQSLVSQSRGKTKAIKKLNLASPTFMVGDGYTDYEVKLDKVVDYFIAYTETINRPKVTEKADYICTNFQEVLDIIYEHKITKIF